LIQVSDTELRTNPAQKCFWRKCIVANQWAVVRLFTLHVIINALVALATKRFFEAVTVSLRLLAVAAAGTGSIRTLEH